MHWSREAPPTLSRRVREVTRSRRSPRPLAAALDTARLQWEPATLLAEIQRVWPGAVGAAIAAEAQPTSERSGVVTVSCSASVWAQELDLMGMSIVGRLNAALKSGKIERLRCVAVPPREASF
jgi:predicted nucleic acid-binding Zn ribbon protein